MLAIVVPVLYFVAKAFYLGAMLMLLGAAG